MNQLAVAVCLALCMHVALAHSHQHHANARLKMTLRHEARTGAEARLTQMRVQVLKAALHAQHENKVDLHTDAQLRCCAQRFSHHVHSVASHGQLHPEHADSFRQMWSTTSFLELSCCSDEAKTLDEAVKSMFNVPKYELKSLEKFTGFVDAMKKAVTDLDEFHSAQYLLAKAGETIYKMPTGIKADAGTQWTQPIYARFLMDGLFKPNMREMVNIKNKCRFNRNIQDSKKAECVAKQVEHYKKAVLEKLKTKSQGSDISTYINGLIDQMDKLWKGLRDDDTLQVGSGITNEKTLNAAGSLGMFLNVKTKTGTVDPGVYILTNYHVACDFDKCDSSGCAQECVGSKIIKSASVALQYSAATELAKWFTKHEVGTVAAVAFRHEREGDPGPIDAALVKVKTGTMIYNGWKSTNKGKAERLISKIITQDELNKLIGQNLKLKKVGLTTGHTKELQAIITGMGQKTFDVKSTTFGTSGDSGSVACTPDHTDKSKGDVTNQVATALVHQAKFGFGQSTEPEGLRMFAMPYVLTELFGESWATGVESATAYQTYAGTAAP